jgi:hypothetical protein
VAGSNITYSGLWIRDYGGETLEGTCLHKDRSLTEAESSGLCCNVRENGGMNELTSPACFCVYVWTSECRVFRGGDVGGMQEIRDRWHVNAYMSSIFCFTLGGLQS